MNIRVIDLFDLASTPIKPATETYKQFLDMIVGVQSVPGDERWSNRAVKYIGRCLPSAIRYDAYMLAFDAMRNASSEAKIRVLQSAFEAVGYLKSFEERHRALYEIQGKAETLEEPNSRKAKEIRETVAASIKRREREDPELKTTMRCVHQ